MAKAVRTAKLIKYRGVGAEGCEGECFEGIQANTSRLEVYVLVVG